MGGTALFHIGVPTYNTMRMKSGKIKLGTTQYSTKILVDLEMEWDSL